MTELLQTLPLELVIPAVVSALITFARQFSSKLDGSAAFWWSVGVNVAAQVTAELAGASGAGSLVGAAALGIGTGAVVGPGLATAGKRVGLAKVIKPRDDGGK